MGFRRSTGVHDSEKDSKSVCFVGRWRAAFFSVRRLARGTVRAVSCELRGHRSWRGVPRTVVRDRS